MSSDTRTVAKLLSGADYDWVGEVKDSYCVSYTNNSSSGNRYVKWHGLWVYKSIDANKAPGGVVVNTEKAHSLVTEYDWRAVFAFIEHGIFTGLSTQTAITTCSNLIKATVLPDKGGQKKKTWNGLTSVLVSERTRSMWALQKDVKTHMMEGFAEDMLEKRLLSEDWVYMSRSHSGWSRSC
jgi:hypothetical protein|tara:strand:- start:2947 stop:3489 length:543 start_codon:yes stop_codon:yes gene_type:complete